MKRHGGRRHGKSDMRKRALIWGICLVAVLLAGLGAVRYLDQSGEPIEEARGDLESRFEPARETTYAGNQYVYKDDLTTILFIGVDRDEARKGEVVASRDGGQADFLMLLVLDKDEKTAKRVQIDRDTMTEITTLGVFGNVTGTRAAQICLSHGFGDGGKESCELTVQAVETLLDDIDVDFYVAMDMGAVGALNDALGGVTVSITEDMTEIDPAMTKGATLTLRGDQAEAFVRARSEVGAGTNEERMGRQQRFLSAAIELLNAGIAADANYAGVVYDAVTDELVANVARGRLVNEAYKASKYEQFPAIELAGEYRIGEDGFMEFHADADALERVVVETFFRPKG